MQTKSELELAVDRAADTLEALGLLRKSRDPVTGEEIWALTELGRAKGLVIPQRGEPS